MIAGCAQADPASDEAPPPPWHLPRFDGADEARNQPPDGALEKPPVLDARGLFDLVVTCFPARSWWKPEVAFEARYANAQHDSASIVQAAENSTYAGVVARIPLYSALELDREREREANRRNVVAQTIGQLEQQLAARTVSRRELGLWRSIEARSGRRVAAGVAETSEQIAAITKVAALESKLLDVAAELTGSKLTLIGMCADRSDVERAIDAVLEERR